MHSSPLLTHSWDLLRVPRDMGTSAGVARGRLTTYVNDGLEFQVSDSGPVSGSPVVLLHGFPQRSTCWEGTAEVLNRWGYRTFAPDQRGYSPRARPRTRAAYGLPALVEDVVALIEEISGPGASGRPRLGRRGGLGARAKRPRLVRSLVTVSAPHPRAYARSLLTSTQAARSFYAAVFQVPLIPEKRPGWCRPSRGCTAPLGHAGASRGQVPRGDAWRWRSRSGPGLVSRPQSQGMPRHDQRDQSPYHAHLERRRCGAHARRCGTFWRLRCRSISPGMPGWCQSLDPRRGAPPARAADRRARRGSRRTEPLSPYVVYGELGCLPSHSRNAVSSWCTCRITKPTATTSSA